MKKLLQYQGLLLIAICCLPLLPLFHTGLPNTHDGVIHVARIANFYQNLTEGVIVPRWAANLNWGFGTPILMFVYPLSSYAVSLFHSLGISLVDSTKVVFALAYLASVASMFLFIRSVWGKGPAFVASVLYAFAPYRFVDLYVRGALGEHVAFIFPPLMCFALVKLAHASKSWTWYVSLLSVSTAGLILSHNALSVMFLPVVFLYGIFLFFTKDRKKQFVIEGIFGLVYGFLLSAFFWIPAVLEQKYTLIDTVVSGNEPGRFTSWMSFMYSPWSFGGTQVLSKQLGPVAWVVIGASLWFLVRMKKLAYRWFIIGCLLVVFISLYMMTQQSSIIWKSSLLLAKFQFPWRFLSVTTFVVALLGGGITSILPKGLHRYVVLVVLVGILYSVPQWQPSGYIHHPDSYYTDVFHHTTDSGETSPVWSVRFMLETAQTSLDVISGSASWDILEYRATRHTYFVNAQGPVQLLENTLYFPGWRVFVDGREVPVEFQNPIHHGLMTFEVGRGQHTVDVLFGDTKVRTAANVLSLGAWSALGIWHIIKKIKSHYG